MARRREWASMSMRRLVRAVGVVVVSACLAPTVQAKPMSYEVIHRFTLDGPDGFYPHSALIQDAGGVLYGTTEGGGVGRYGTLFSYDPSASVLTTLASFDGTNGAFPNAAVIQGVDGALY